MNSTRMGDGLRTPPSPINLLSNDPNTVCKDCKSLFFQDEQNKGIMAYHRCTKCQKVFFIRTCIHSCIIL